MSPFPHIWFPSHPQLLASFDQLNSLGNQSVEKIRGAIYKAMGKVVICMVVTQTWLISYDFKCSVHMYAARLDTAPSGLHIAYFYPHLHVNTGIWYLITIFTKEQHLRLHNVYTSLNWNWVSCENSSWSILEYPIKALLVDGYQPHLHTLSWRTLCHRILDSNMERSYIINILC